MKRKSSVCSGTIPRTICAWSYGSGSSGARPKAGHSSSAPVVSAARGIGRVPLYLSVCVHHTTRYALRLCTQQLAEDLRLARGHAQQAALQALVFRAWVAQENDTAHLRLRLREVLHLWRGVARSRHRGVPTAGLGVSPCSRTLLIPTTGLRECPSGVRPLLPSAWDAHPSYLAWRQRRERRQLRGLPPSRRTGSRCCHNLWPLGARVGRRVVFHPAKLIRGDFGKFGEGRRNPGKENVQKYDPGPSLRPSTPPKYRFMILLPLPSTTSMALIMGMSPAAHRAHVRAERQCEEVLRRGRGPIS